VGGLLRRGEELPGKPYSGRGGDTILLATGSHGIEVFEEVEMIEVKQGPYAGEQDKTRFAVVDKKLLMVEVNR
jgi:hypothetical protein